MAKKGGSKQKKMDARVDFTPMVDMIMLLVTFFMLCTTLIKPQTMEISMPSDKEDIQEENKSQIAASKAVTILIDGEDKLYYFQGKPDEAQLYETKYGVDGIRTFLMSANGKVAQKVAAEKKRYAMTVSSNPMLEAKQRAEHDKVIRDLKNSDESINVVIKASDAATYKNMIDVLDEMLICNIGKYVIDKFADGDKAKIEAYKANPAQ